MTRIIEILKKMYHMLPEPPSTKYLDKFIARYQMAHAIHPGSYFLGRKSSN